MSAPEVTVASDWLTEAADFVARELDFGRRVRSEDQEEEDEFLKLLVREREIEALRGGLQRIAAMLRERGL